jgi:hypothetical protein
MLNLILFIYFIQNNLWNWKKINFFLLFHMLDLILILLVVIYFIWIIKKLEFFLISSSFNFLSIKFNSYYFNKLEKNKTLISYFSAHFSWHSQTLRTIFNIFFITLLNIKKLSTLQETIFYENYFSTNKRDLSVYLIFW